MKRFFIILFVIVFTLCSLSGCSSQPSEREIELEYAFESGRDEGFYDGLYIGRDEGAEEAQKHIASRVEDDIWSLDYDIKDKWGIYPEDAIQIITNYAIGEPVSERDLNNAIWAISEYYVASREIIHGIEDYFID